MVRPVLVDAQLNTQLVPTKAQGECGAGAGPGPAARCQGRHSNPLCQVTPGPAGLRSSEELPPAQEPGRVTVPLEAPVFGGVSECVVGAWDLHWGATTVQGLTSGMGGALASRNWTPAGVIWLLDSVGAGPSGC